MRNNTHQYAALISSLMICALVITGCTKDQKSSTRSGTSSGSTSGSSDGKSATTSCGVVIDGKLKNPVELKDGQLVDVVDVLSNNLIAIRPKGTSERILLKLQGIASAGDSSQISRSTTTIRRLTSAGAYFFKATPDCNSTVVGGGTGTIGSLITPSGVSVGEELLREGSSSADTNDACYGDLLGSCYQALDEAKDDKQTSSNVSCGFLWKPESDKDGNLAVLVDECSVKVLVNGEELEQAGAGNARCTTVRGSKPGCAYGQATVEIFDEFTGLPYVFQNGETKLQLNGCQRFELPCT